jgi:hypothetical protein
MPNPKKACLGRLCCVKFYFEELDKKCRAGHNPLEDGDGNIIDRYEWGLNCPDWEHRSEPKRMPEKTSCGN